MPVSSEEKERELMRVARDQFDDLTEAELKLLRAAPSGDVVGCGPSADDADPANDPANSDT